jgi:RNA polymerase sigma-70 factor (ECF subfamily)
MPYDFEQFRHYLVTLASAQVDARLRDRLDVSGVVQETLLEAARQGPRIAPQPVAAQVAWLRQILAHNLTDAMRALRSGKRDVARERPLTQLLAESSFRLGTCIVADQPSPSSAACREERAVRVADALAHLPESQRQALTLRYWHGLGLAEIAAEMRRTPVAAAGLLKRGLVTLRQLLNTGKEDL